MLSAYAYQDKRMIVEAQNYATARGIKPAPLSYVVVKRRSAGIEQAWVVQDLQQWLEDKYANT